MFQTTDSSISVPADINELATSSPTTKLAEGMARPNFQSSRVRVTKSRAARGAVGCGPIRSSCLAGVGVDSAADSAGSIDAVTIRCRPKG
jgi:hypothetical protein